MKKGESVESIITDFRGQLDANAAAYAERWLTMPEPKDKTSDEWRYWKLRRMERAFDGDDSEAYIRGVAGVHGVTQRLDGQ